MPSPNRPRRACLAKPQQTAPSLAKPSLPCFATLASVIGQSSHHVHMMHIAHGVVNTKRHSVNIGVDGRKEADGQTYTPWTEQLRGSGNLRECRILTRP